MVAAEKASQYLEQCMKEEDSAGDGRGWLNMGAEEDFTAIEIKGRHDPVIVPRAVVVVESMAAITLVDAMFSNMSARMDYVKDFYL